MLIGYSAYSIDDAVKAQHDGADYIGIGAVFSTSTKKDVSVIGLDALHQARKAISIPLVAIGGINAENVNSIMSIGVDAAAVISALTNSDDIESATRLLVNSISSQMKTDG
jgi:thiamine-phosphate pyrophosphorylase